MHWYQAPQLESLRRCELYGQCTPSHSTLQCRRRCIILFKAGPGICELQVLRKWPSQDPLRERSSKSFEECQQGMLWRCQEGELPQRTCPEGGPWGRPRESALAGAFGFSRLP